MYRKSLLMALAGLLWLTTWAFAQPPHPLDFFPHHVGDHWEYRDAYDLQLVEVRTVERDSVDSLESIFIKYIQHNEYTVHIDTNYNVYDSWTWGTWGVDALWYKLNSRVGDRWVVWMWMQSDDSKSDTTYLFAELKDIYEGNVFGIQTLFKEIDYWISTSPSDSFWIQTRTIAAGFGLVQIFYEPGGLYFLAGAIIDSVQYGWVVNSVEEPKEPVIPSFELYQNYPNPFNPTTNIRFQIARFGPVNLTIYDLSGRAVKTLLYKTLPPGTYTV
ncbi:MAG: T9SS C-terminal target domain-containing protein, partial [Methanobacteriota archaeon]